MNYSSFNACVEDKNASQEEQDKAKAEYEAKRE